MSGWITYDYACSACGWCADQLVRRDAVPETLPCPDCAADAQRLTTFGGTMDTALPDGNRRFQGLREQRTLQKAARRAAKAGDRDTLIRAKIEQHKQRGRV